MIKLKEAIIVEGKYDKIKLSSIVDGLIITTDGFGIFKDKEKRELIKLLAKKRGIIILTDSDSAGFLIRSHIKGFVKKGEIKNVFVPDIFGKEKRKTAPSKEGKLGVEGISREILESALKKAGIANLQGQNEGQNEGQNQGQDKQPQQREVTKTDLFEDGLSGGADSKAKRALLLSQLGLPRRMSTNTLLEAINALYSYEEYKQALSRI